MRLINLIYFNICCSLMRCYLTYLSLAYHAKCYNKYSSDEINHFIGVRIKVSHLFVPKITGFELQQ